MIFVNQFYNFLSQITSSRQQHQTDFMRAEMKMLRKRCPYKRINLTGKERNILIKLGEPLGTYVKYTISINTFDDFRRWVIKKQNPNYIPKKRGRPRKLSGLVIFSVKLSGLPLGRKCFTVFSLSI